MSNSDLKVLIIDSISLYRKVLSEVLSDIDGVNVVGTAGNGNIAISKINQIAPDIITLDIDMPKKEKRILFRQIKNTNLLTNTILVSSFKNSDSNISNESIEFSTSYFVTKPDTGNLENNVDDLKNQLRSIIKTIISRKTVHDIINKPTSTEIKKVIKSKSKPEIVTIDRTEKSHVIDSNGSKLNKPIEIVTIGISTGGPIALLQVIPELPKDFPVPVVIVQHMPPEFTKALAVSLDNKSSIKVVEAVSGETLEPGTVYIAPGGKQMKIVNQQTAHKPGILITNDAPEHFCKPSINYLFRSAAKIYNGGVLGVIMTGMGSDGLEGLKILKDQGAVVFAQDEATSVVFGMPEEAIKAGIVDSVLPLKRIAPSIIRKVNSNLNVNK